MSEKFSIEGLSAVREPTSVSFKKSNITNSERTMSGKLVVDYIATKSTLSVSWSVLTDSEFRQLMALVETKQSSDSFFTIRVVAPGTLSSAAGGEGSAAGQTDSDTVEEVDLTDGGISPGTPQDGSTPASDKLTTLTAYAEEVSYYPYFMADGSVVWRDVSIEFSEV